MCGPRLVVLPNILGHKHFHNYIKIVDICYIYNDMYVHLVSVSLPCLRLQFSSDIAMFDDSCNIEDIKILVIFSLI